MTLRFETGNKDDAFFVRTKVFMEEQGFQDEFDEIDERESTIHLTMYVDDALVGCSRTFPDPDHAGIYIFGRLAVLPEFRKNGYGGTILEKSEGFAKNAGANEINLHAQCSVTPFYEAYGYEQYGEIELDEHVEHIWMKKSI